jgi:hypothetical protein
MSLDWVIVNVLSEWVVAGKPKSPSSREPETSSG